MASMNERSFIGKEVVLAVRGTGSGSKVIEYDGTGLAEGYMTKNIRRYFYGEHHEQDALEYAERTADKIRKSREETVSVFDIDERIQ